MAAVPRKPPRQRQYSDTPPSSYFLDTSTYPPGKPRPISVPSVRIDAAMDHMVQSLRTSFDLQHSKGAHSNGSIPYVANGTVPLRSDTESPIDGMDDDVLVDLDVGIGNNSTPGSVFENSDMGEERDGAKLSPLPRTKKQPLLPPTARSVSEQSSKMSPRVPRQHSSKMQETSENVNKDLSSGNNGKTPILPPVHITHLNTEHDSSSSVPAEGVKKPTRPLLPPSRPIYRTVSKPEESITSEPSTKSSQKPVPLPRLHKAMSVGGETRTEADSSGQEPGTHIEAHFQPISPAFSSSSGIVEDLNSLPTSPNTESALSSPYSDCSSNTPTSSEPVAVTELPPDHPRASPPVGSMSNSKSSSDLDKSNGVDPGKRKANKGRNYPKIQIKNDSSWISRNDSPTSPPFRPPPPTISEKTSSEQIPYRSHPIIPRSVERQSCMPDLLAAKSKPVVSPHGTYYPPAASGRAVPSDLSASGRAVPPDSLGRSLTPDPKLNRRTIKEGPVQLRKTKSNERLLASMDDAKPQTSVPKRGTKARRSISFHGSSNKQARPVSMMDDVMRYQSKEGVPANYKLTLSGGSDMKQMSTNDMKQLARQKSEGNGKQPCPSPLQSKFGRLFKRTKGTAQVTDIPDPEENAGDEQESGESSEDDVGGTIKRLPKLRRVSEDLDDSESPDGDGYALEYSQLFEYVFVVGLKEDRAKKLQTEITYQFPPTSGNISKDPAIRSINQFCFPDIERWKPVTSYCSESYSFVLTSLEGNRRFGYCRRLLPEGKGARLPEVYCIISPLGCFDLYSKILDHVEQRRTVSKAAVFTLLKSLIANPFPAPGRTVSIRVLPAKVGDMEVVKLTRPHDSRLEHVDFGELYNTLGPKRIIQLFSSLLMERRVILSAQRLSTLSSCCHALLALLYPFEWQHTFIPVLPSSLIDFCGSPLPFIIGINPDMAKQLDHLDVEMEEAVVVDLDKRSFLMRFGDETYILPSKLFQYLMHILENPAVKSEYSKPSSSRKGNSRADEIVVDAFMTVFAYLYGNYRDFLATTSFRTRTKKFQRKDFVKSFHSKSTQRFLDAFQMTQMFEMFIDVREDPVKAEAVTKGLFENKLPELKERVADIEQFSTRKNRFRLGKRKAVHVRL